MILYFAADLLWASKIKGAADAAGLAARPVRSIEMLEARLADSPVKALIVDLDVPETALALIGRLRGRPGGAGGGAAGAGEREPGIRVLAFGPHVAVDALSAAKAAGADVVMARGAFAARMGEVLARLSGGMEAIQDDLEE